MKTAEELQEEVAHWKAGYEAAINELEIADQQFAAFKERLKKDFKKLKTYSRKNHGINAHLEPRLYFLAYEDVEKLVDSSPAPLKEEPKPDYINKEIKKVSEVDLKKALKEVNDKNEQDRQEQREATNKALADGFRCGPAKSHNAKRFEPGEHQQIIDSLKEEPQNSEYKLVNEKDWHVVKGDSNYLNEEPQSLLNPNHWINKMVEENPGIFKDQSNEPVEFKSNRKEGPQKPE